MPPSTQFDGVEVDRWNLQSIGPFEMKMSDSKRRKARWFQCFQGEGSIILKRNEHKRISDTLHQLSEHCGRRGVFLSEILDVLENQGFGILLVFLSFPSALPIPAPGYSTPFGLIIFLLGCQMLVFRRVPWLPQRAKQLHLSHKTTKRMTQAGTVFFGKIEHFIKPRMHWVHRGPGHCFLALLVICMSLLMCLPIPLTNTFPAMVIFLIGVSCSEQDGVVALGAGLIGVLAVLVYCVPVYLLVTFISEHGLVGGFEVMSLKMATWKAGFTAWLSTFAS